MLPDGWHSKTVADICQMQNGNGFGPEDWGTEGYPIIRIQNLNGGTNFDYYSGPVESRWLVEPGQLLFAWAGTKGVSFGPTIWSGRTGVLNQHIFKVNAKEGIDKTWLYWALRHVTDQIEANAHGFKATLVHVKKSDIDRQEVLVPDLGTQRWIARALQVWEDAIYVTEGLLANSSIQRQAVSQALLSGQRRFASSPQWQPRKFADLITESRLPGSAGHIARKLTVKLYGKGVVAKEERRQGSESTTYYTRCAGQFIYSKLDFLNGAFGLIPAHLDGYESTLDLPAFDLEEGVEPRWFLYYVARESFYKGHLGLANGGRKARRVNPSDLLAVNIKCPSLAEQRAIANVIDAALADEHQWEAQIAALKAEKRALMADLLTGKRRVRAPDPMKEPEAA